MTPFEPPQSGEHDHLLRIPVGPLLPQLDLGGNLLHSASHSRVNLTSQIHINELTARDRDKQFHMEMAAFLYSGKFPPIGGFILFGDGDW